MLVSKSFPLAAAFSAGLLMVGAGMAHAADPGGASLSVTGNVQTEIFPSDFGEPTATITAEGDFIAQNLISDFNSVPTYVVESDLTAGGREFFDISFDVTPGEINGILAGFGADVDDVAPFLTALVTGPDGTVLLPDGDFFAPIAGLAIPGFGTTPPVAFFEAFEGIEIVYSFDVDVATASQLSGSYSVSSTLTGTQLGVLENGLEALFGPINFEDDFDFAFNASISPEVAPVPVPAALPMMLGGLALFGLLGWRRRTA